MRCIEILELIESVPFLTGLIETWDVLKCKATQELSNSKRINRNMRCIEIARTKPACHCWPD